MVNAILLQYVGGIISSLLDPVADSLHGFVPTPICAFDQLGLTSSFMNFNCSTNLAAADLTKVGLYLTCILSSVTHKPNLFDLTPLDIKNPACANVDFDSVSLLLAKCEWCRSSGCYQVGGKFITLCNPISLPPQADSCLGVHLQLYTRSNPYPNSREIYPDLSNIESSNFDFNENTTIFIPGFLSGYVEKYEKVFAPAILNCTNQNVIIFDWGKGASTFYHQALSNTRVAGNIIANFLKALNDKFGYSPSKVHLIGHSLGSQIAGFAGSAYKSIGRITGLDPAGPGFDCDPKVRLDPTDADFVDIIHTQAGLFGSSRNLGHVDFWPNGGKTQRGCDSLVNLYNYTGIDNHAICNHLISIHYYASSMRFCQRSFNCSFTANMCPSYSDFQAGKCKSCGPDGSKCASMGYFAQNYALAGHPLPAKQPFYLNVPKEAPYCLKQKN